MPDNQHAFEQALQLLTLQQTSSPEATQAVSTLAESSKSHPDLRTQLADPRVLGPLIEIVKHTVETDDPTTTSSALRCMGNACIDNDAARSTITAAGFAWAYQCLHSNNDELRWLAVKVLYNICSDHEAAQLQCYREHIHYDLISICASPLASASDDRSLIIDLLFWITSQKANITDTEQATEPLPSETLLKLLNLPSYYFAASVVLDDFATLLEICLPFLRDPHTQTQIVESHRAGYVWQMLQDIANRIALRRSNSPAAAKPPEETVQVLRPYASSLIWILSDIAANPKFAAKYDLNDSWIHGLLQTIKNGAIKVAVVDSEIHLVDKSELGQRLYREARSSRAVSQHSMDDMNVGQLLRTASCQIIGNLLWALPPQRATPLIETDKIHEALWQILSPPSSSSVSEIEVEVEIEVEAEANNVEADLTYSATSLLIQLTRPSQHVRELIGAAYRAKDALTALCEHKTPQIQQMGIKLLRALGKECPLNQERFGGLAAHLTATAAAATAEDAPVANGA
ncbi:hypothetical protein LTR85_002941 [Meristemomyces frigidus]|nr:hypothetical protein LTR85_002941 [Meristemomyces frigidus]